MLFRIRPCLSTSTIRTGTRSATAPPLRIRSRNLSTPPQQPPPPSSHSHSAFYKTHGRAFFKSFTLAFLTYQLIHHAWLTFEAEEQNDALDFEVKSLEGEVRLLEEGRKGHRARVEGDGDGR